MTDQNLLKTIAVAVAVYFRMGQYIAQPVIRDQLTAIDALCRKVREYRDDGDKKKNKFAAIFYRIWHQGEDDKSYPVKNSWTFMSMKILLSLVVSILFILKNRDYQPPINYSQME